ncbi:MAG: hypothetical protein J6X03_05505, partial [Bacilli bacterium]|nr:hypothetical protein [Bacilli bacterium]
MNHLNAFINLTIYAISFSDIQNGINIFITCLFPAVIVGLVLAGLNGMRKGIWRVTYDVLMLSVFYLTAFLTLNPLIKTVFSMDLSFAGFTNVVITNTQSGVSFYVPITNVLDTFTGVVEGFYALFDVQADPAAAAGFALAVAGSLLKLILVFVHLFLITLFGWLISFILWHAAFKKIVPNIARKLTKLRLLSLLENAVKYVVIAFLFMSPTTAIVNSINQAYQNSKANLDTNSESVKNIGGFLDSYNDSLFAKAFFNWTVDKDGITFDAKFIAALTEYSLNGSTVSLTGEFNNVISSVGILLNVFDFDFDQMKIANIDVESLLTENMVESVFDIIKKSGLITSALPIVTEIALNSNVLNEYFEARRIGSDTIDWEKEGDNIKDVLIEFVESDLKDLVFDFDEHGGIHMKELNVAQLIKDILNVDEEGNPSSTYYAVINAIESIDKSNLLSNVVPVAMKMLYESVPPESGIQNFLPTTWDELRDIQWGFEFKTLLDCVHRLFTLDKNGAGSLLDLFFQSPGGGGSGTEGSLYAPKPFKAEGDEGSSSPIPSEVIDFIIDNLAGFGEILFGTFDGEGNPTNVDKYGRTRITGTNQKYCLFDMRLMKNLLEPLIDLLSSSLSFDDEQLDELNSVVDDLTSGINWMGKYKKEFNSMFSVLTAFTENEEAKNTVKGLISGQPLVPEGENIFSLGQPIIDALSAGLRKLDNSNLAYAIFVPMLKNALMSSESYFIDMGLDIEYIKGGIDECYRDKCFGEELANILKRFKDIGNLAETISSGSDTTELLNRIAESSDSIIKILDTIANCKIFNPTPIEGRFEPNGNYFNLISNLFNQLNMDGFTFDRNDEEFKNMVWVNKYDNNDNILKKPDGTYYGENGNFVNVI